MSKEFKTRRVALVSHLLIIVTSCSRTPQCSAAGGHWHSCRKHLLLIFYISITLQSLKCYHIIYMVLTTKFRDSRKGIINPIVQITIQGTQRLSKLLIIT